MLNLHTQRLFFALFLTLNDYWQSTAHVYANIVWIVSVLAFFAVMMARHKSLRTRAAMASIMVGFCGLIPTAVILVTNENPLPPPYQALWPLIVDGLFRGRALAGDRPRDNRGAGGVCAVPLRRQPSRTGRHR